MKTVELVRYGILPEIIDVWEQAGLVELQPVQARAIKDFDLFGSRNLIVSAPTSSGKTFVGEMAAVKSAVDRKKSFYCVPLKALAEEKYYEFKKKYEQFGIKVVISSRDRREHDEIINSGEFSIAIVVYEKLQQIITRNLSLLDEIGLVVIDELQMLSDESRGAELELLLTKLKMYPGKFKILGLSAVLKNCRVVPEWLGADFLEFFQRPVELRRGILYKGTFHYEEFNSGRAGEEKLIDIPRGEDIDIMTANAAHLAEQGEQCLIFLKDKSSTRNVALTVAGKVDFPSAEDAIGELTHIEDTASKFLLIECLEKGVAFHNADMNIEEREVVERHFRSGNIRMLCSTSTLAMGVNLPARNVFLEPNKWHTNRRLNRPQTTAITKGEFENMGGRAGRFSMEKEYGRAIFIARTEFDFISCRRKYIEGEIEELESHLFDDDLGTTVLNLVASGVCRNTFELKDFITNSLSWFRDEKKRKMSDDRFEKKIGSQIALCLKHGLFEQSGETIVPRNLGLVCAAKGISLESALLIIRWLKRVSDRPTCDIETLYIAAKTRDAQGYYINMSTQEYRETPYQSMLEKSLDPAARKLFGKVFDDQVSQTYEKTREMKVALVMNEWILESPLVEIEKDFNTYSGTIQRVAEGISWIVDAIAGIEAVMNLGETRSRQYDMLARRLLLGIETRGLSLANLRVKGLNRFQISKLVEAGFTNVKSLKAVSQDELAKIIPIRLVRRIFKRIGMIEAMRSKEQREDSPDVSRVPEKTALRKVSDEESNKKLKRQPFKCQDRIHFDGRADKRRTYIVMNDREVSIPNRDFEILIQLAIQLVKDGDGWLMGEQFAPDSAWQTISRVRNNIRAHLLEETGELVENNGFGAYRLSVPPTNLTFDWDMISSHWNHAISVMAKDFQSAAV